MAAAVINIFITNQSNAYNDAFVPGDEERRLMGILDSAMRVAIDMDALSGIDSQTCRMPLFFVNWMMPIDKEAINSYFFTSRNTFGYYFATANGIKKFRKLHIDATDVVFPAKFRVPAKYLPVVVPVVQVPLLVAAPRRPAIGNCKFDLIKYLVTVVGGVIWIDGMRNKFKDLGHMSLASALRSPGSGTVSFALNFS